MALYCISIGNRKYQVKIGQNEITLNGEPVNLNLIRLNSNGLHLLRKGNVATEIHLQNTEGNTFEIITGGQRVVARVDEACRKSRQVTETVKAGELIAPMPGLVVEVLVKEGETVETGQVLVILESMKMQMQMRSSIDGRVTGVPAKSGSQVEKGSLLVKIE